MQVPGSMWDSVIGGLPDQDDWVSPSGWISVDHEKKGAFGQVSPAHPCSEVLDMRQLADGLYRGNGPVACLCILGQVIVVTNQRMPSRGMCVPSRSTDDKYVSRLLFFKLWSKSL